jgi:NAD(P)-dependent dehydrogenase (short-subunit alcohol dehydrogenase family)
MPPPKMFDLSGHVAVVTGGNGGIGRGIALGLAQAGAAVAVLARNEEKNQRVMSELQALGVAALAVRVDVAERGELQPALEKVEETLGPVSILVNNAGIAIVGGVLDLNPDLGIYRSRDCPKRRTRVRHHPGRNPGSGLRGPSLPASAARKAINGIDRGILERLLNAS